MDDIKILNQCVGFQWDSGNLQKNWIKHNVTQIECEQVFFNDPLLLFEDYKHSHTEVRYYLLGKTHANRKMFIVFTVRKNSIRIISARDMHKKEREIYVKAEKENSTF